MRGTACNFDSIVTKICICLDNGSKKGEFEYGPKAQKSASVYLLVWTILNLQYLWNKQYTCFDEII